MKESQAMQELKKAAASNEPVIDIKIGEDDNNQVVIRVDRVQKDAKITSIVKDGVPLQKTEKEKREMLGFFLLTICLEAYENGLAPEDRERLSTLMIIFDVKSR